MSTSKHKPKAITFALTLEDHEALSRLAVQMERSVADTLRILIRRADDLIDDADLIDGDT